MNLGGSNYTNFRAIRLRETAAIRLVSDSMESTLAIRDSMEAARVWYFPDKSGTVGLIGTFTVNLPAVTSWGETAVTISGLRREDAFVCQIKDMGNTVTTGRTFPIIAGARPENGYVYLTFYNPTGTATLYGDLVLSYVVAR